MNLEKKLAQWLEAGIIDAETRTRIQGFERGQQRPILLYALGGLGAFTIAIGLVSIVAANWEQINAGTKLGVDLTLGAMLAAALYFAVMNGKSWQADLTAGIYYGFTIASISLLGQIYQLGSPTYQALLIWSACTLPLMTVVRGRVLALTWLSGLIWTHTESVIALVEWLDARGQRDAFLLNLVVSIVFLSTLLYLVVARLPWVVRERPQLSAAWTSALWAGILASGLGLGFAFYDGIAEGGTLTWGLAVAVAVVAVLHGSWPRLYPQTSPQARVGLTSLLALICLVLVLGLGVAHPSLAFVGALAQVLLLAISAWTVLQLGYLSLFNVLTAAIAFRILVAYFEVFGSLLDTGLGMITGGILTLLLAWLWKRKSPELAARLAEGGTHAS